MTRLSSSVTMALGKRNKSAQQTLFVATGEIRVLGNVCYRALNRLLVAHQLAQAVDLETGAIVATTVQTMDGGDPASLPQTLDAATRQLEEVGKEVVADKWHHSNATMVVSGVQLR